MIRLSKTFVIDREDLSIVKCQYLDGVNIKLKQNNDIILLRFENVGELISILDNLRLK